MKYNILGFLIFLVTSNFSYAQTTTSTEEMKYQINLIGPGGEIEFKISNKSTGLINLGILPAFNDKDNKEDFFLNSKGTTVIPFIDLQYRYFYNLDRRKKIGKSINQNTGNFIALKSIFYLFSISKYYDSTDNLFGIGAVYGIQRNFFGSWNLTGEAGLGFYNFDEGIAPAPLASITLGYIIN